MRKNVRQVVFLLSTLTAACAPAEDDTPQNTDGAAPFSFLADAGPEFVPDDLVGEDGLLLDRLDVLLENEATADSLAAALAAVDAEVVSSRPGLGWLTVRVPPVTDRAGAEAVAATLATQLDVLAARPAWLVEAPIAVPAEDEPTRAAPTGIGGSTNPYLGDQRFYAAWNASTLARTKVEAWVIDSFTSNTTPPQLSTLRFVGPDPEAVQPREVDGTFPGNHGFWVASVLGADADERPPLGTHPAPSTTLDLIGVNHQRTGSTLDLILLMDRLLPTDRFVVVNTSFGFASGVPPEERALAGLAWREVLLRRTVPFLHAASAGNDKILDPAETRYNSIFSVQASVDDIGRLLDGKPRDDFDDAWEEAIERQGARIQTRQGATMIVGASTFEGVESTFSNRGADVRMIGEGLTGVCGRKDRECIDGPFGMLTTLRGTSGASPQVAGLAAWLRSMDPTLEADDIVDLLLEHFDGRWVDALGATLALEGRGVPVRRAWLDYFGDGTFDADDLTALLTEIDAGDAPDAGPDRTWPRADLNGDGFARSGSRAPVDLDGDGALSRLVVEVPGDEGAIVEELVVAEAALTDLDILCWAAFGALYTGDEAARDALLTRRCQPVLGYSGTIVSRTEELCPSGQRTTTYTVTVTISESGEVLAVSGVASIQGEFSNVTPGDCVLREQLGGPFVLEGAENHVGEGDAGSLSLPYLGSGTLTYTGVDDCPAPRVEEEEERRVNLPYVRGTGGSYDFTRTASRETDCTETTTVEGVLR